MGVHHRTAIMTQEEVPVCLGDDERDVIIEDSDLYLAEMQAWLFLTLFSDPKETETQTTGSSDHFLPVSAYASNESEETIESDLFNL